MAIEREPNGRRPDEPRSAGPEHSVAHEILDTVADGVALIDSAWRFAYVNPKGAQLFGSNRAELLGSVLWKVSPELEQTAIGRACRQAMAGSVEVTAEDSAPFNVWVEARVLPAGGRLLLLLRDISARKRADAHRDSLLQREQRARAESEDASRMKDEFLAVLSHELRTPLNSIVGWAHLLNTSDLNPTEEARAIETILRNAKLQTTLIEDMLDISRIIMGKLRLQMARVQVPQMLEAASHGVRPMADAKGVGLRLAVDPAAGDVMGDAHRLQQVIWNLLANAIKFTLPGGHIALRCERLGAEIVIEVRDTGQGIRPDFLPHIFERFRQADGAVARSHGGLGLGLAIVRYLVELHGGAVQAASEGEGRGATFTVTLPAAAPDSGDAAADLGATSDWRGVARAGALAGATVLIVDDKSDAREVVVSLVAHEGANVVAASSAEEALIMLKSERPDVLVCGLGTPDQEGFSFLRKVRASGEAAGGWVPAIALSEYATEKGSCEALLAGFQIQLMKPVEPHQIIASIAKLWRRGKRNGLR